MPVKGMGIGAFVVAVWVVWVKATGFVLPR